MVTIEKVKDVTDDTGILPYGNPSRDDAAQAVRIAERICKNAKTGLRTK